MIHSRLAALRARLRQEGLDALLVSSLPNIRYLTSFSGSNGLCIVKQRGGHFLTDARYALQSRNEVTVLPRSIAPAGLIEWAAGQRLLSGCRRVGVESHIVSWAQYRTLKRLFPSVRFVPTSDIVEEIALVKDREELALIRKAVAITDAVYRRILPMIRPGVRELEIAAEISSLHRREGADSDAFDPIVAGGPRGALPHARPTARRIRNRELLTLDMGCTLKGYGSDLTRTVAVGRVPRRLREIYRAVAEAQAAAIGAARGGMVARQLDAVARNSIAAAGYGRYFIHSLGHGLGLHPHERPRISSVSREVLRPGSVVTIEPGIYIPGVGGVRIEDDVVLTGSGCRVLSRSSREFTVL